MIGRDTIYLASHQGITDYAPTQPISGFTRKLGEVADRINGHKNIKPKLLQQTSRLCIEAALAAQSAIEPDTFKPTSHAEMVEKSIRLLSSDILLNEDHLAIDPSIYHQARRDFRAVLHAGVSSYLVSPNPDKLEYVKRGIEISHLYGDKHTEILALSKKRNKAASSATKSTLV